MEEGVHFTNYFRQGGTVFVWSGDFNMGSSLLVWFCFFLFFSSGWGNFWYITFFWKPLAPLGNNKWSLPLIAALARLFFCWGGGRGVFEICFGEYSQTNGISFGMGLIWLICCSFGQNKLPLRNKTLDRKRSTPNTQTREFAVNTQTRHRRRKRGGGLGGLQFFTLFIVMGAGTPLPNLKKNK